MKMTMDFDDYIVIVGHLDSATILLRDIIAEVRELPDSIETLKNDTIIYHLQDLSEEAQDLIKKIEEVDDNSSFTEPLA